jgi:hypothetical protein
MTSESFIIIVKQDELARAAALIITQRLRSLTSTALSSEYM